jgi:hypothetical protein
MNKQAILQAIGWGSWLILAGVAMVMARLVEPTAAVWAAILAGGILSAGAVYLTGPAREKLPARLVDLGLVAGLAVLLELGLLAIGYGISYVLAVLALPLLVAGLRRRNHRWLLVVVLAPAGLAVLIPLVAAGVAGGDVVAASFFGLCALPLVVAWLIGRAGREALWAAYGLVVVGLLFPLTAGDRQLGPYLATYLLAAAGLPLLLPALARRRWDGPAFVGYGLLVLAVLIPLEKVGVIAGRLTAAYLLLATATGLLAIVVRRRQPR